MTRGSSQTRKREKEKQDLEELVGGLLKAASRRWGCDVALRVVYDYILTLGRDITFIGFPIEKGNLVFIKFKPSVLRHRCKIISVLSICSLIKGI